MSVFFFLAAKIFAQSSTLEMRSLAVFAALLAAAAPPRAAAYDNGAPNARLPTLGWSSWIALGPAGQAPVFDYCDEFTVKNSIDAFMQLGFYEAGYRHVSLDDCWAGGRNATGYLYPEPDHFPNGMKPLIDYAHSFNLTYGLYTCAGNYTCVGNRPGSRDHWDEDAAYYAEVGADFMKMDWCATEGLTPQPTYTLMSNAINKTGHPLLFSMCEWGVDDPWNWGFEVAQAWRMAGDHTGVWSSTKSTIAASAAIPVNATGRPYGWNDMDMLETGCYEQCAHANGRQPNMTATEYKTEFSMWAISASPLRFTAPLMNCSAAPLPTCSATLLQQLSISECTYGTSFGCSADNTSVWTDNGCRGVFSCNGGNVTCDVNGTGQHECGCPNVTVACTPWISDLQREILLNTDVIAINQDVTPQGTPVVPGDLTVWARMLSDGSAAVALYNQEDAPAQIAFKFSSVGWPAGTTAHVRDLWAHADLGTFTDAYPQTGAVTVAPHETQVFRVTKV
jgi:alpha-galactosidase